MTIYDAAMHYKAAGVPLMVLAGKEYGSGSSRDWAAKGTLLLGVKAVIAESFERIHRSNLVNMGVLPLQFHAGETAASLGLTGRERYDLAGIARGPEAAAAWSRSARPPTRQRRSSSRPSPASTRPRSSSRSATAASCRTCCGSWWGPRPGEATAISEGASRSHDRHGLLRRWRGPDEALDIYFIDVEGGQSTLLVTPAGQSLLVDTGFAGSGFNDASNRGRDARRIAAVARDAGLKRIDFLLTTHFHADHVGGVVDLVQQIPIRTFIDHGRPAPATEKDSIGSLAAFNAYAAVRAKGRHLEPKPGDRLPLKGVDAVVVSSALATIVKPLAGAGGRNSSCPAFGLPAQEPDENPRSTGFLLRFGKFRFLDVGDLTGKPLFALACPNDLVGPLDVYLVAHHGGADAADPATLAAFRPRVAILNNGERKGGAPEMFAALRRAARDRGGVAIASIGEPGRGKLQRGSDREPR